MDELRVLIKITQPTICALLLMGCAHSVEPSEPLQDKIITKVTPDSVLWHDGSKGGDYGIGEGWSIELVPAEYETVFDVITVSSPTGSELITIPAEYEWIRDDSADLSGDPIMVPKLVTIPAEYMTVTETIVVKPQQTSYYLTDAIYTPDGSIKSPKTVKPRFIPAVVRHEERQVINVPERTVERVIPLERRKGYRRVVKTPARVTSKPFYLGPYYSRRFQEAQPWRFLIKNPKGSAVHLFDDFETLATFVDDLK